MKMAIFACMSCRIITFFVFICAIAACSSNGKEKSVPLKGNFHFVDKKSKDEEAKSTDTTDLKKQTNEKLSMQYLLNGKDTLVPVNYYNKNIFWELKYATSDNFMHRVLYDTLETVYIQKSIALRLAKCQEKLSMENADYHLLVYDGLRPLSVQWEMWKALDTIPVSERGKFVSNPKNGSVHNYGAAVDITICDNNRKPLDMGAGYDDIRKIAYPSLEAQFLASGELTAAHVANRNLLRKVMKSQQFNNIPSEWWHFNAFSRQNASVKYKMVTKELLPNG
jgi:D-alanyl-D-alanine dipeptidase